MLRKSFTNFFIFYQPKVFCIILCSPDPKHNCLNKQGNWWCMQVLALRNAVICNVITVFLLQVGLLLPLMHHFFLSYYFWTLNAALKWLHWETSNLWLLSSPLNYNCGQKGMLGIVLFATPRKPWVVHILVTFANCNPEGDLNLLIEKSDKGLVCHFFFFFFWDLGFANSNAILYTHSPREILFFFKKKFSFVFS